MPIRIQPTPNPNARKFILPHKYFAQSLNISQPDQCLDPSICPVIKQLFGLGGIYNILLAQDFITINKFPDLAWEALEQPIVALLEESFP